MLGWSRVGAPRSAEDSMVWHCTFGVAAAVVGLFLIDRVALWAERRGWLYWRTKQSGFAGSGAVLGIAADAFQPNRIVHVQEMEHKRIMRQQVSSPDGTPRARAASRWPDIAV